MVETNTAENHTGEPKEPVVRSERRSIAEAKPVERAPTPAAPAPKPSAKKGAWGQIHDELRKKRG